MEGKIIYQGLNNTGKKIIVRYPESSDAPEMTDYINKLSDERTFITYQGEHENLESEANYLNSVLGKIQKKKSVHLLVFVEQQLAGIAGVDLGDKINSHVGILGISIDQEFRGKGIGKILMENILTESADQLKQMKILTLGVFSNNAFAYNWYKKLGFKDYGNLPKGVKLENGYVNHIYMYKEI